MNNTQSVFDFRLLIILGVATAVACAPTTERVKHQSYESRARDYPITIFVNGTRPQCGFEELATVAIRSPKVFTSTKIGNKALKVEARKIGGDALINVSSDGPIMTSQGASDGGGNVDVLTYPDYRPSGTVVRWSSADCTT